MLQENLTQAINHVNDILDRTYAGKLDMTLPEYQKYPAKIAQIIVDTKLQQTGHIFISNRMLLMPTNLQVASYDLLAQANQEDTEKLSVDDLAYILMQNYLLSLIDQTEQPFIKIASQEDPNTDPTAFTIASFGLIDFQIVTTLHLLKQEFHQSPLITFTLSDNLKDFYNIDESMKSKLAFQDNSKKMLIAFNNLQANIADNISTTGLLLNSKDYNKEDVVNFVKNELSLDTIDADEEVELIKQLTRIYLFDRLTTQLNQRQTFMMAIAQSDKLTLDQFNQLSDTFINFYVSKYPSIVHNFVTNIYSIEG